MLSYGSLLKALDPVELVVDPFVPDMPGHLLLLAHAIELALGYLNKRRRKTF